MTINKYEKSYFKEAYELHDTLNPKLFDLESNKLKPEVLQKLKGIYEEFLKNIDPLTLSVADVQFVGSNAGYNYNDKSDIDLHLIVNFDLNYIDDEILQSIYNDKKNKFNDKYDFKIYEIPVEVYVENINSSNATNGIYSILNNEWVKFPEPIKYNIPDYSKELEEAKRIVNEILKSGNPQEIEDTINGIYMARKNGLAIEGEVSIGNLVFKELRNLGLIDGLRNKYCELRSEELSLEGKMIKEDYRKDPEYQQLLKRLSDLLKKQKSLNIKSIKSNQSDDEIIDNLNDNELNETQEYINLDKEITQVYDEIDRLKEKEFNNQGGNLYKNKKPKEATRGSYEGFSLDTNDYHQDYLENPEYAKMHHYNGVYISEMSPDEYMSRCSKEVFETPIEDTHDGMENKDNVQEYAELMKNGTKFDMPFIDAKNKTQEGRHRAMAAKQLGINIIPVLYLY